MEEKVSIIGIIVENSDSTDKLNELLHKYSSYIIGRMGIPYKKKDINVISIWHPDVRNHSKKESKKL